MIRNLDKRFVHDGHERVVLNGISFAVEDRSFTTIAGPSGCGKSTSLNIMVGIDSQPRCDRDCHRGGPRARIGYVFRSPRLLPWLSVLDNLLFVRPPSADKQQFQAVVMRYLSMVGLEKESSKFPLQLSGGMQLRVGIVRALAIDPDVLLMDEPFSHLDELSAENLRTEPLRIWSRTVRTILFVTHDLQEAIELGDRMLVFGRNGKLLDDIAINPPRPRDFTSPEVASMYGNCTRRFVELQHTADADFEGRSAYLDGYRPA